MSYLADVLTEGRPSGSYGATGLLAYLAPDPPNPETYINVRLSNGSGYYNAGGTSISGGAALSSDQGAPNLLSAAWPVKMTDGTSVFGTVATPINVTFTSGGLSLGDVARPFWVTGSVFVLNPSGGGAGGNVTAVSGSVTGLLVGGQSLSQANPLPVSQQGTVTITGSVSLSQLAVVTGTMALSRAVDVASLPSVGQGTPAGLGSPWPTVLVSGSDVVGTLSHPLVVTGSLSLAKGVDVSTMPNLSVTNVVSVTGTVHLADLSTVTGSVSLSRAVDVASMPNLSVTNVVSVTGTVHLADVSTITGTVVLGRGVDVATMPNLSVTNVVTVTGTVHMADVSSVTGTVALARGVDVSSLPAVSQGTAGSLSTPWRFQIVSGGDVVGQSSNPFWVTGSVFVINQSSGGPSANVTAVSGSVVGLVVGGVPLALGNPLPITGSVSLTQGVAISTMPNVTVANPQTSVTVVSGSVGGLLVGGQPVSNANPVPTAQQGTVTTSTTLVTGSQTGLLLGANPVAASNPLPVTGTVHLADVSAVTGTITLAAAPTVFVASGSQTGLLMGANPVAASNPLAVQHTTGSQTGILIGANPVAVSNPFPVAQQGTVTTSTTLVTGSQTGILIGANPIAQSNPLPSVIMTGSVTGLFVGGVALSEVNPVPTRDQRAGTATVSSLTASVTSQLLKAALTTRLGMTLYNDSVANAYLKWGGSVASNDFSFKMMPDDYYEVPYGHTGRIDVVWTAATGTMRITEFT